jgi:hypothetical protein
MLERCRARVEELRSQGLSEEGIVKRLVVEGYGADNSGKMVFRVFNAGVSTNIIELLKEGQLQLDGDLTVKTDNAYNIGAHNKRIREIFLRRAFVDHYVRTPEI